MSRKATSARRRTAILAAALACFQAKGVRATTIGDVHRQAGVSVGSIYHHFADKQQLARTAYVEGLQAYQSALLQELVHYRTARAGIESIIGFDLGRLADPAAWSRSAFPVHELTLEPATG